MRHPEKHPLFRYYTAATAAERRGGHRWYRDARATARCLAREFGNTEAAACGVIAALSPRVTWSQNVRLATDALAGITRPIGAFRANAVKAAAIVGGARPLSVLRGNKVRAFYRALRGDESACVIDGWMARAMRIRSLTARTYALAEYALRAVAAYTRTTAAKLQAVVWTVIRGGAQ